MDISNDIVLKLFLTFAVLGFAGFLVGSFIYFAVKQKRDAQSDEEEWNEPETKIIGARVIDKRIADGTTGSYKMPKYNMVLLVTFLTDDGDTVEYEVNKEVYERVYVDQTGDLLTINEVFFDFGDGEEIVKEE